MSEQNHPLYPSTIVPDFTNFFHQQSTWRPRADSTVFAPPEEAYKSSHGFLTTFFLLQYNCVCLCGLLAGGGDCGWTTPFPTHPGTTVYCFCYICGFFCCYLYRPSTYKISIYRRGGRSSSDYSTSKVLNTTMASSRIVSGYVGKCPHSRRLRWHVVSIVNIVNTVLAYSQQLHEHWT